MVVPKGVIEWSGCSLVGISLGGDGSPSGSAVLRSCSRKWLGILDRFDVFVTEDYE